jgi:hypothetical protein
MRIEAESSGDPVDVLTGDKVLMGLVAAYVGMMGWILYGGMLL